MNDNNSLAHTSWNCKYHKVFAPKYRRKVFYGQYRVEVGKMLRELCEWKGVHIIEAELCPEYIQNQLKEDQVSDQMTIRGWDDPFTGSK